jgi:tetratricopeptide (TPR) repeat protein
VLSIAVAAVTIAVGWPVVDNGFVNWGDTQEIVENEHVRGFDAEDLAWMFTRVHMGHYQPLTWLTFALDHELHGLDPRAYHRTSLSLHAACAVAAYFLIRRLVFLARRATHGRAEECLAALPCAAAGALLFALHPLRVEAVAWAAERRGPLAALCCILSVWFYLGYAAPPPNGRRRPAPDTAYWLSWTAFLLALLAKEFSLTLPAVLLVLDFQPLRRVRAGEGLAPALLRLVTEKAPFVALTSVWIVVAYVSSQQSAVARSLEQHGLVERLAQAAYGLAFYPAKTLWPTRLANLYPLPQPLDPFAPRFVLGALAVLAITLALVVLRRRCPSGLTAWICYAVIVSPVLGLLQTGHQLVADRYSYLPAVALGAVVAAALLHAWNRGAVAARAGIVVVTVLVLVLLGGLTRRQIRVWKTSESLWAQALAVSPGSAIVNHNYGVALGEAGRPLDAIPWVVRAIELDDRFVDAYNNYGSLLAMTGRLPEATEQWRAALRIEPANRTARENLERALRLLDARH